MLFTPLLKGMSGLCCYQRCTFVPQLKVLIVSLLNIMIHLLESSPKLDNLPMNIHLSARPTLSSLWTYVGLSLIETKFLLMNYSLLMPLLADVKQAFFTFRSSITFSWNFNWYLSFITTLICCFNYPWRQGLVRFSSHRMKILIF